MAVYAIGDVQGCYKSLTTLLRRIGFVADKDQLWFTGDLVNRGPDSLEVLRLVSSLGEAAITVLGNHDLHLLAAAAGSRQPNETLTPVLRAPDVAALIDWLAHRPLLHHDAALGYTLVHAGLAPQWDLTRAQAYAREVEDLLCGTARGQLLYDMYGDRPDRWSDALRGADRWRFIINAFTRIRYCSCDGRLNLGLKGPPERMREPYVPWFQVPGRASAGLRVVFGHWSTLGLWIEPDVVGLDTGCVWGGRLTSLRLDLEQEPISVACVGERVAKSGRIRRSAPTRR